MKREIRFQGKKLEYTLIQAPRRDVLIQALEGNEAKSERVRHALAKTRFASNVSLQTLGRDNVAAMRVVEQSRTSFSKSSTEPQIFRS